VLAAVGLGLVFVICTGDQLVLHLYDLRCHAAAWMVGILAVGLWHTMHYNTLSAVILALSKSHYNAGANLVYCVSLFSLIPLGFHFFGMLGAVVAAAVGDVPVYFVVLYGAFREKVDTLLQDALPTAAFVMTLAGVLALRAARGFGSANRFREFIGVTKHSVAPLESNHDMLILRGGSLSLMEKTAANSQKSLLARMGYDAILDSFLAS
jgi:hypothetical protein